MFWKEKNSKLKNLCDASESSADIVIFVDNLLHPKLLGGAFGWKNLKHLGQTWFFLFSLHQQMAKFSLHKLPN